jgi:non-ribosomal peptide synthetase component F
MAQLPDETLSTIFRLQQRLVLLLDTATAAEYFILQQFGETEETMPELEAIDNVKERLRIPYNRLHRILQQVAESQPAATADVLEFLYSTIAETEAAADASEASIQEIKRSWNLS